MADGRLCIVTKEVELIIVDFFFFVLLCFLLVDQGENLCGLRLFMALLMLMLFLLAWKMGELLFEKMKYIRDGSTNALALLIPRFKVDVLFLIRFSLLIIVCV